MFASIRQTSKTAIAFTRSSFSTATKSLTVATLNENMKKCRYEVRGEIYLASVKRAQEGKEVIPLNIGNPQSLGQKPLTFNRQVLSLLMAPFLLDDPNVSSLFPDDVIQRAKKYLNAAVGGVGAYSDSKGVMVVRQEVADFIQRTTGQYSDPNNIFLSNGASDCARLLLSALIRGPSDGIMVPIPQYPLYSAAIALYGGELVPYYLDEAKGWSLNIDNLQQSIASAKAKGILVRALVLINPGNPTGQSLSQENMESLIQFCTEHSLILCADEVYQENIYDTNKPFQSARKILGTMPNSIKHHLEVVSFHSTSKGFTGECGLRGGYMELHNFQQDVVEELYKVASVNLCPNLPGQFATGLMVNPPQLNDSSYRLYELEKTQRIQSLQRRAKMLTEALNSFPNISCQPSDGAMYAFPQIFLPKKAIEIAKKMNKNPDVLYCLELLHETGLCCVPGSGFQQAEGTFHFRTTILVRLLLLLL
jgi:glutamate--glyoxylate aminotransferase